MDVNDVVIVRKRLVDERHEEFVIITKPFRIMLEFVVLFSFGLEVGGYFLLVFVCQITCGLKAPLFFCEKKIA